MDHFWNPGDRALTSGYEHHALHRPLVKLVDQGVDVEVIPHLEHEPIILEALEDSLKEGKVKLVAITAACNVTGELLPIKEVIELAHQYEAKVLIDAAQIAGWWDLDFPGMGADLVAVCWTQRTARAVGNRRIVFRDDLEMNSPAAVCEMVYDKDTGKPKPAITGPGWCDGGSVDRSALAGLAAGVEWLVTSQSCESTCLCAVAIAADLQTASDLPNVELYGSDNMNYRMPTIAFTIRGKDSILAARELRDRGVIVAGGMHCAPLAHKTLQTAAGRLGANECRPF